MTKRLAQSALDMVANNSVAHFLGDRIANARNLLDGMVVASCLGN